MLGMGGVKDHGIQEWMNLQPAMVHFAGLANAHLCLLQITSDPHGPFFPHGFS